MNPSAKTRGSLVLGWTARVLISVLFFKAGWDKITDPETFARSIQGYQLTPYAFSVWIAWILPWLEIWCAVSLWIIPVFRRSAWTWINLMLIVFTVAKLTAVLRGLDITCGCTGSDTPLTWASVLQNLVWMAVAVFGWMNDHRIR